MLSAQKPRAGRTEVLMVGQALGHFYGIVRHIMANDLFKIIVSANVQFSLKKSNQVKMYDFDNKSG